MQQVIIGCDWIIFAFSVVYLVAELVLWRIHGTGDVAATPKPAELPKCTVVSV